MLFRISLLRVHREVRLVQNDSNVNDFRLNCGFRNIVNYLEILGSFAVHDGKKRNSTFMALSLRNT